MTYTPRRETIYVEKCPDECGIFNCRRCWKAAAAAMEGIDVVRYTPSKYNRSIIDDEYMDEGYWERRYGESRQRTMDLKVIEGGKTEKKERDGNMKGRGWPDGFKH